MTGVSISEAYHPTRQRYGAYLLLLLMVWTITGICMKRATISRNFGGYTDNGGRSPKLYANKMAYQQASETPTPSATSSAVISPTLTITPTITTTSSVLSLTPSATATMTLSPAPSTTQTETPTSLPVEYLPTVETQTPQVFTPEQTQTATSTLIPFPTVSISLPTSTSTPRLLHLINREAPTNLKKGETSPFQKIGKFMPIVFIAALWMGLFIWIALALLAARPKDP